MSPSGVSTHPNMRSHQESELATESMSWGSAFGMQVRAMAWWGCHGNDEQTRQERSSSSGMQQGVIGPCGTIKMALKQGCQRAMW